MVFKDKIEKKEKHSLFYSAKSAWHKRWKCSKVRFKAFVIHITSSGNVVVINITAITWSWHDNLLSQLYLCSAHKGSWGTKWFQGI